MGWKLFLDDMRYPEEVSALRGMPSDWVIARTAKDAQWYVRRRGMPDFISFDHDLADEHYGDAGEAIAIIGYDRYEEQTGLHFAKWLCDLVAKGELDMPAGFKYHVHSMNPVGAENIRRQMQDIAGAG